MGRHKTTDKHLPPRMRQKGKSFYYVINQEWEPIGDDYALALMKWRDREGLSEGAATVSEMLDNTLVVYADRAKPSTFKEFTRAATWLKKVFEGFTPPDVEPGHIAEFLEKAQARVSANRAIAFLSISFELARRRRWLSIPNPCTGVKRNKERNRKRTATPQEIYKLLFDENGKRRDEQMADMVEFTLMTAIRQQDIVTLRRSALELEGIRVKPLKTDESTEAEALFMWNAAMRVLIDRVKARKNKRGIESIYVFPVRRRGRAGQAYTGNSFRSTQRKYFAKCGVTGLSWHDLRRTALRARDKEQGKEAAQKLALHSSITTTEGYLGGVGAVEIAPVTVKYEKAAEV